METVLEVKDLKTYFFTRWGTLKAVDGVSFHLNRGETLGIVGESGCGKTITSLSLLRLVPKPAGRIISGEILLEGENILRKTDEEMRKIRGDKISMILQDPMSSLNPVFSIGYQIKEAIKIHQRLKGYPLLEKAKQMLAQVKIASPALRLKAFPHQMSGGMRQRVVGAISLACEPTVLIADEPTTSLDVTVQAQYLKLLKDLQAQTNFSIIFITHDLGIVAQMCDRVSVMYAGRIVETAPVIDIFDNPAHPYTHALISSVPAVDKDVERLYSIDGQPPALHHLPAGCAFKPRCKRYDAKCRDDEYPPQIQVGPNHTVNCWQAI